MAEIIDGKSVAAEVVEGVKKSAATLATHGVKPGLAVVIVGEDPASQVYVANKSRTAKECGFHSVQHTLAAETSEADLVALVEKLNADPAIHGILVQLPLPGHIDAGKIIQTIAPDKGEGKSRLVGDVEFASAEKSAGAITPVPGGVGPMTIAMLMANTLVSAYRHAGLEQPGF